MKKRVFSGTRATGRLHLGNYLGAVKGYLELQNNPEYEAIYMVMDLHAITTPYDKEKLSENTRNVIMDYLACGLDPKKSVITAQSLIPEHTYLAHILSSEITVARMQHLPTFKEKIKQHPDNVTMALLNYPVLMAADILLYKASLVPVGIDQEPHLEVAREITRKMNEKFGLDFPEPKRFATKGEYIPSLTGEGKMSKSVEGSYINLKDDLETIKKKLSKVPTDQGKALEIIDSTKASFDLQINEIADKYGIEISEEIKNKKRKMYLTKDLDDRTHITPGPFVLFDLLKLFAPEKLSSYEEKYLDYNGEGIRYGDLKLELAEAIYKELEPIQKQRKIYEEDPSLVDRVIHEGAEKARRIAQETIDEVRTKIGLID